MMQDSLINIGDYFYEGIIMLKEEIELFDKKRKS